jgi:hypothetical protein
VKTTLVVPLVFARTLICGLSRTDTVPAEENVPMSAPVSALTTVKLVIVCALTHMGTHSRAPKKTVL